MNQQTQNQNESIDAVFFHRSNYGMLFGLLNETLQSRFNMSLTSKTSECVKTELLRIMKDTFEHRNEFDIPSRISVSEFNLIMNKAVLDASLETIPNIINRNMSCRPKNASSQYEKNIDDAFDQIQLERNKKNVMPKNPFTTTQTDQFEKQVFNGETMNRNSALEQVLRPGENKEKSIKQAQSGQNSSFASYNDTDKAMSFLDAGLNTSIPMTLAETIKMFNEEAEELGKNGDDFVSKLEEKKRLREEEFHTATELSATQQKALNAQIEDDKENAVKNVYPMDFSQNNDGLGLPQTINSHDPTLSLIEETNVLHATGEANGEANVDSVVVTSTDKMQWVDKRTIIQLNSLDRENSSTASRYEYTIDTSLFGESIKHVSEVEILNLVIPSFEKTSEYAHTIGQYLMVSIPELNTHNVGSNSELDNSQCMLFVDKIHCSNVPTARGSVILKNDNETTNKYAKNVMRQLPRQLTIKLLKMDGTLYGNEFSKDDYKVALVQTQTNDIKLQFSKPFAQDIQFRIGDTIHISDLIPENGLHEGVEEEEEELGQEDMVKFLERKQGHVIIGFGETKTFDNSYSTENWCREVLISNKTTGSMIPIWGTVLQSQEALVATSGFSLTGCDGKVMNVSSQNTITLAVTSKSPSSRLI